MFLEGKIEKLGSFNKKYFCFKYHKIRIAKSRKNNEFF